MIKKAKHRLLSDINFLNVIKGSSKAFIFQVSGRGMKLIYTLFIARILGVENTGRYFLCMTIVGIGALISKLGLPNYIVKHCNINYTENNWKGVHKHYHISILLSFLVSIIVIILIYTTEPFINNYILKNINLGGILSLFALAILPISLNHLNSNALKAIEKPAWATFTYANTQPIVGIPLVYYLATHYGINGAIYAFLISSVIAMIFSYATWYYFTAQYHFEIEKNIKAVLSFSFPLLLVASMNFVMTYTDTLSLGILSSQEELGAYEISWRIANVISFILLAFSTVLSPKFAGLYSQGKVAEIEGLARKSSILMALVSLPVVIVFIFLSPFFIPYIFGSEYILSIDPIRILTIARWIHVFAGPVGFILIMCGHQKILRNVIVTSAALNILLNILLIPIWDGVGAAIATGISLIVHNLATLYMVYRKMNIIPVPIFSSLKTNANE